VPRSPPSLSRGVKTNVERNEKGVFIKGHITSGFVRDQIARTLDRTGDLTGQKFGQWIALKKGSIDGRLRRWLCRCDCGLEKEVSQRHLVNGKSTCCLKCSGKKITARASARCLLSNGRIKYRSNGGGRAQYWITIRKQQFEKQKGICSVCLKPLTSERDSFDHDHETNLCRELVHTGCNVFIGFVENHPGVTDRVQNYLEKYRGKLSP